ncbi:MAG TPA: sigma-54 dependent transcriptional regulator [Candidatus Acidoferrales bacterium]|nr:sigma-54 dependent transcriptional regulator [Candidatus Acidoferrales bacterium]
MANSILIVDDEQGIREVLSSILTEEGYEPVAVPSGEECLSLLEKRSIDLVLLDVWLEGIDGLETLERMRKNGVDAMVVMISGHASIETAVRATKLGAFDFIEKPLSLEKVILVIKNALEVHRLAQENRQLREELGGRTVLQGETVPMRALRQQIALTAPTHGRVLIYGESGTGKELVARALHAASLRAERAFVEVNCAAIPEELIESELFGHIKGSFTGATENKVGKFEKADGGTLFLDEIGDMSLRTQAKVLRVLEEQRLEPVGSNQTVTVDVRVIAATNKTLEDEIAHGRFREDLFYRLNVIPFTLPPLRERIEDVPVLARYFMLEFAASYGRKPKEFGEAALGVMARYSWPGNVRELRNLIERLMIIVPHDKIEPLHLPAELFRAGSRMTQQPNATLHEARSAYEREFILRKLEENQWQMTRTAEALGLERSHLYRRMRALGIKAEE